MCFEYTWVALIKAWQKKKKTRVRTEGGWTENCCKGDAVKVCAVLTDSRWTVGTEG